MQLWIFCTSGFSYSICRFESTAILCHICAISWQFWIWNCWILYNFMYWIPNHLSFLANLIFAKKMFIKKVRTNFSLWPFQIENQISFAHVKSCCKKGFYLFIFFYRKWKKKILKGRLVDLCNIDLMARNEVPMIYGSVKSSQNKKYSAE